MKKCNVKKSAEPLRVGFIGCGKMGGAILEALLAAKMTRPAKALVCDAFADRVAQLERSLRVRGATAEAVVRESDVVFLAVKPQDMAAALAALPADALAEPLFVSIAAGRRLAWLEERLPGSRVVRVMPNLAVSVGQGVSGFCGGSRARVRDVKLVEKLLSCTGVAIQVPEERMDAVTALGGSGPAFIAYALQAMIDGGVAVGLEEPQARTMAIQTMLGTATVLAGGGTGVADFIRSVTSAKGTTAAGLAVLEKSALQGTMKRAIAAAARRSRELSELP
ncbi:MAG: pyrroline-5-carboxylate reductase [Kiritimatiellia bacterium]|jgi:pyrroline-5-carboxylate reductase